ncbi:methyl-accepting chemotaxis protein [Pseudomarimonas arenosa]|uniref:methyl-accepting chemotaxis protein n=1 Tax=Pseudomarimonas arenosa TaxID=2774145 RepID=UPI001784D00F
MELEQGRSIASTTDTRGIITDVNDYMVEISGYRRDELIGRPHNIVRHPDMPPAAFTDLWRSLKQGLPWVGVVKNRCKNGDHYWVLAHVTPVFDTAGKVTGYMSVRRRPSRDLIDNAERDFAAVRAGRLRGARMVNGQMQKPSLSARWNPLWRLNLATRLFLLAMFGVGYAALLLLLPAESEAGAGLRLAFWPMAGFAAYSAWWLARDVSGRLQGAFDGFEAMAQSNFDYPVDVARGDEVGRVLRGLKSTQIRLGHQLEKSEREAAASSRVRRALEVASANVMVADHEFRVVFVNQSLAALLKRHEQRIAESIPQFSADTLVGMSIDRFHKDPGARRSQLMQLNSTHRARLEINGLTFDLSVTPVLAESHTVGYVTEWADRTEELAIEREVEQVVSAASEGRLDQRITEHNKGGHNLVVASGINQVLGAFSGSLASLTRVLQALAEGDLTRRVEERFSGAFAEMAEHANQTVDRLAQIVGQIQSAVSVIDSAASEISSGNADLSERSEQQAANLEETASSVEQLTATVQQNAANARSGRQVAESVSDIAQRGGDTVRQAVNTMRDITAASKQIEDIISVMDGIAFQTNILALNAAVEAARAGEQGRGFAVVASEVRALAQRSATSAKEIKQLIADSVQAVEKGALQVNEAGETIGRLVAEVGQVSTLMSEISAASDEQASGIGQVSNTINHLDSTTQQNAALVEQASAAARALSEEASKLGEAVSVFRLRR